MSEERKSELRKLATTESGVRVFRLETSHARQRAALNLVERGVEQFCRAELRGIQDYIRFHKESNRERPNGWLRDFFGNLWRAELEALKTIRFDELID